MWPGGCAHGVLLSFFVHRSLWKAVLDLFADAMSMVGNKKPPSAQLLYEGCALVCFISQAPTRRPTTSIPDVIIVPDGSLRTGQTSNPAAAGLSRRPTSGVVVDAGDRCHDACMATDSAEESAPAPPVVISISPMAHF